MGETQESLKREMEELRLEKKSKTRHASNS